MGDYGEWSPCTKECGGGAQIRLREIIQQAENNGTACGQQLLSENRACNVHDCAGTNSITSQSLTSIVFYVIQIFVYSYADFAMCYFQLIASLDIGKIGLLVINHAGVVVSTEPERLRHLRDMVENFAKAMPRKCKFVTRNHVPVSTIER